MWEHLAMAFVELPSVAAWRHCTSRTGLEAASFENRADGWVIAGSTTAVEAGRTWWVRYDIELSSSYVTRRAAVSAQTGTARSSSVVIEGDGEGRWVIDGRPEPALDGCLDVDLESSAMTNALPMRRLSLAHGEFVQAPAVYVRVEGLHVQRLEQSYLREADSDRGPSFDYQAATFDFACRIAYDLSGLVTHYPGIAERVL
jgi:uncharacterized protein